MNERISEKSELSPFWKIIKYSGIFIIGAVGYGVMEILWRGHTHYSMLLAGGLVLCGAYFINARYNETPLFLRAVVLTLLIVTVELVFGLVFNILLGEAVWDYSDIPLNFYGQICPTYSLLWLALSTAVCGILDIYYARKNDGE